MATNLDQSIADFTDAARDVRGFFFAFLSITIYIAVVIAGTTDIQLVRIDPVTLPIVNVPVPIQGFYWLVPLLFVVLHFHLLLQVYQLSRRQRTVQAEIAVLAAADAESRTAIDERAAALSRRFIIFPLVQWLRPAAGRTWRERMAYGVIAWLTLVIFPLALLFWAQLRFLPVHQEIITWIQRLVILADCIALWVFMPATLRERCQRRRWTRTNWLQTRPRALREWWWGLRDLMLALLLFAVLLPILGMLRLWGGCVSICGNRVDNARIRGRAGRRSARARSPAGQRPVWMVYGVTASVLFLAFVVATYPHETLEDFWIGALDNRLTGGLLTLLPEQRDALVEERVQRYGSIFAEYLDAIQASPEQLVQEFISPVSRYQLPEWQYQENLHERMGSVNRNFPYRHLRMTSALLGRPEGWTNLYRAYRLEGAELISGSPEAETLAHLREGNESERKQALRKVRGLDLRGRDLRYALLDGVLLPNARLNGACLDHAQLANAILDKADLSPFEPRGSSARRLGETRCGARRPSVSSLRSADLTRSRLAEADLTRAQLQDAYAPAVDLRGTDLNNARLNGANLVSAQLQRADLSDAKLIAADLSFARLDGADLSSTFLRGAKLQGGVLLGVDLREGRMDGADLFGARLSGADLSAADLVGADLRQAELKGADLSGTLLMAADLTNAELAGADLYQASLEGADLWDSKLSLCILARAKTGPLSAAQIDKMLHALSTEEHDGQGKEPSEIDQQFLKRTLAAIEERLHTREGTTGSWVDAHADNLLCDRLDSGLGCEVDRTLLLKQAEETPPTPVVLFYSGRSSLLSGIACEIPEAAERLIEDILYISRVAPHVDLRPSLRQLLGPECEGAKALSGDSRTQLERLLAHLNKQLDPPAAPPTAPDPLPDTSRTSRPRTQ